MNIFEIVIVGSEIWNKLKSVGFFQKTFLVADNKINIVFEILFFIFSNANIRFAKKNLLAGLILL